MLNAATKNQQQCLLANSFADNISSAPTFLYFVGDNRTTGLPGTNAKCNVGNQKDILDGFRKLWFITPRNKFDPKCQKSWSRN